MYKIVFLIIFTRHSCICTLDILKTVDSFPPVLTVQLNSKFYHYEYLGHFDLLIPTKIAELCGQKRNLHETVCRQMQIN